MSELEVLCHMLTTKIKISIYFIGRNYVFLRWKHYVSTDETQCSIILNKRGASKYDVKKKAII